MPLDTLRSRERNVALLERYGGLLTDHQRQILDLHLKSDWSLAEIAIREQVSRSAVHDLVKRSVQALEESERRLGLLAEEQRQRRERQTIAGELAELKKRITRLESRLTGV
jgi:hypothetical protein